MIYEVHPMAKPNEVREQEAPYGEGTGRVVAMVGNTLCVSEHIHLESPLRVRRIQPPSRAYLMSEGFELRIDGESPVLGRAEDYLVIGRKGARVVRAEDFAAEFEVVG